jgi:simple sugar transport system substrate-binding protein
MKKSFLASILALSVLAALSALPKVAVLDILAQKGIDVSAVVPITESIMEEVVATRAYIVLDRAYIEQVLKEQEFDLTTMVNDTEVAKAGQFVGADYVVTGKVQLLGDAYFLVAKMIEVRTGIIVAQASEQGEGKLVALLGMSHAIGKKLVMGGPITPLEASPKPAVVKTPAAAVGKKLKAGFVLPMSIDDEFQSMARSVKRVRSEYKDWLDVAVIMNLRESGAALAFDKLVEVEKCDIVFSCDWLSADACVEASRRYPNVKFESHGGEFKENLDPNLGFIGTNELTHAYVEGFLAASLSSRGKIGFLSDSVSQGSWIYEMINTFALGVRDANPKASVLIHFLPQNHWEQKGAQTEAAKTLIGQGCDFVCGVDGGEVWEVLAASTMAGKRVRMFQKDLSYKVSPNVIVSGPIRDFSVLFSKPLLALKNGEWKKEGFYPFAASRFGGGEERFNPAFAAEIASKKVKSPDLGTISLSDYLEKRERQLAGGEFNPYIGPIKDQKGKVRLPAGVKAEGSFISNMNWFVDNVKDVTGK